MTHQPSTAQKSPESDKDRVPSTSSQQPPDLGRVEQAMRPVEVLAVAVPVLALANLAAFVAVLQARWFRDFFDPWSVPVGWLLFSSLLGVVCWLISAQVEGVYYGFARAGVVLCVLTFIVLVVLGLVWLVWMLLTGSDDDSSSPRSSRRKRRRGSRSSRRRRRNPRTRGRRRRRR